MNEQKLPKEENGFQRFRKTISGMSLEDKIDHIWTYYKGTVLLMILIPALLFFLLSGFFRKEPQAVLSGDFSNVTVSSEGRSYITEAYLQMKGLNPEDYVMQIDFTQTAGIGMDQVNSHGVDGGLGVVASVAADLLDYIVCDGVAIEYYANQQSFLPVEQILLPEQMEELQDLIYHHTDRETGERYQVAINVTQFPFFQELAQGEGEIYLGFANKTEPSVAELQQFLEYLCSWQGE